MFQFSVKFLPTTLFSLKDSNSTNSGAKSLFLPSPYCIKMAILNQAISVGGELSKLQIKNSPQFSSIRDSKISFFIQTGSSFCVNKTFVKILKPSRDDVGFQETVSFREYLHLTNALDIIFEVKDQLSVDYLKKHLHRINYFGKRGCFFQFIAYSDSPPEPNVVRFSSNQGISGILQKYDDFDDKVTFEMVNNFTSKSTKRKEEIWVLPLKLISSSKSYSNFKSF